MGRGRESSEKSAPGTSQVDHGLHSPTQSVESVAEQQAHEDPDRVAPVEYGHDVPPHEALLVTR